MDSSVGPGGSDDGCEVRNARMCDDQGYRLKQNGSSQQEGDL